MKVKNPSNITRARRATDEAILFIAQRISDMLAMKASPGRIAVWGIYLADLYRVWDILCIHERANRRKLTPEAAQQIGSIIEDRVVEKSDDVSWIGILKPMVGQQG